MSFEKWLLEVAANLDKEIDGAPVLGAASMVRLAASLRRCMKQNETYFRLSFGFAVLLALCTVSVAALGHGATGERWSQAGFGVSAFGAVVFAMNRAREKHNFELMLELALGLDENAMRDLLRVMMKKYAVNHPSASALFSTTPQPTSQSFLALLPAGEPAASPTRSSMRALLNVVLKSDPDVDAFCLDYFPSVQKRICVGMDRQTKYNKLLEEANTREILEHLVAAYPERVAAQQSLLLWEPPRT